MVDKFAEQEIKESLGKTGGWKPGMLGAEEANKEVRKLHRQRKTDLVTGLSGEYPLHDMIEALQNRWQKDYRKGVFLKGTFIIADLDGLHEVNHAYGKRDGGNFYLRAVGKAFVEVSRSVGARCFRNGNQADEFTMYLPGTVLRKEVEPVLDKIDSILKDTQNSIQTSYNGIRFSLSYSVATFHRAYGPKETFNDAENKMGEAKEPDQSGKRVGNVGRIFVNEVREESLRYE